MNFLKNSDDSGQKETKGYDDINKVEETNGEGEPQFSELEIIQFKNSDESDDKNVDDKTWKYHPLLEPLILKSIIGYLGVKDQRKCRLVCQFWNSEVKHIAKAAFPVSIKDDYSMTTFLELFKSPISQFPTPRDLVISFEHWEALDPEQLYSEIGEHLKSLTLINVPATGYTFINMIPYFCPNLEEFNLILCFSYHEYGDQDVYDEVVFKTLKHFSIKELFFDQDDLVGRYTTWILKSSPNLRVLTMTDVCPMALDIVKTFLEERPEVREGLQIVQIFDDWI